MKVKANFDYNDIKLERLVKKGEVIDVTEERGKDLLTKAYNGVRFVSLVEEEQEEVKEEIQELKEEANEEPKEEVKPKKRKTKKEE